MARLLMVDDDPDILNLAEQILGKAGHTVFTSPDALSAIESLNQIEFDLLISDANMPHYTGFELIHTVRNNPKFKHMSIVMLTGLRERKDVERALTVGVDDYIVKPIDPLLLIQKVNSLFEKKPAQNYPEVRLSPTQATGTLQRKITVESISELGLRITCDEPLKAGQILDINAEVFRLLDIQPPPLKVLQAEMDPATGQCRAHLIFLGAREVMLQKIRRWLYTHTGSLKRAA